MSYFQPNTSLAVWVWSIGLRIYDVVVLGVLVDLLELISEVYVRHLIVEFVFEVLISSHVCIISTVELEHVSERFLSFDLNDLD